MAAIAFQSVAVSYAIHLVYVWSTYFLCLHGPHDRGTRFLLRTTLNCGSGGDCPALDEVVEGGVGGMLGVFVVVRLIWERSDRS
jgi:hypothetical protein